ncbi:MAG TPA: hypothetical protein VG147_05195 [Solirubrobacteraceae bacterium]|nr:hypothetical protein [Solirubrobacteraceae bacterium]
MNAQTTSPSGQPAIDPELRTQTQELAKPTEPSGAQTSPDGGARAGAEAPAGMELPPPQPRPPGFRERGRMRRRMRFLRKARELAYRDLGGLVFEMQRSRQRNDELVAAKLGVLASFDTELRALEQALGERRPVTVLREAGIGACPRCAAIHGSDDRYCPMCGMPMSRPAESPIAATPPAVAGPLTAPGVGAPAPIPGVAPPSLAAASVAAAATVTPGQLPLSAAPVVAPAKPAPAAPPPLQTSPPVPARPATEAPMGAPVPRAPTPPAQPPQEDRPTEIIRPQDEAG